MGSGETLSGWVLAGILAIISTLTSTVAFLYKKMSDSWKVREMELKEELRLFKEETLKNFSELNARAANCEKDRVAMMVEIAILKKGQTELEENKKNRDTV